MTDPATSSGSPRRRRGSPAAGAASLASHTGRASFALGQAPETATALTRTPSGPEVDGEAAGHGFESDLCGPVGHRRWHRASVRPPRRCSPPHPRRRRAPTFMASATRSTADQAVPTTAAAKSARFGEVGAGWAGEQANVVDDQVDPSDVSTAAAASCAVPSTVTSPGTPLARSPRSPNSATVATVRRACRPGGH